MTPINDGTSSNQCIPSRNIPIMKTKSNATENHKHFTWSFQSANTAKQASGMTIDSNMTRGRRISRARIDSLIRIKSDVVNIGGKLNRNLDKNFNFTQFSSNYTSY